MNLTNSLKIVDCHGKGIDARLNTNVVNRLDGWFKVPFAQAGTWRFRLLYDDRVTLFLDGAPVAATAAYNQAVEADVPVTPGWHRYEICTFDGNGSFGPGDGSAAVSYAVSEDGGETFGEYTPFNEDSLTFSLAPDGYMQGSITLASGATVANVSETAALVYGDISADGATGAVMSGKFACVSNTVDFGTVAADTDDLTGVLRFDNAATNLFADVGKIAVDFASRPTHVTVTVGPAGGLEALDAAGLKARFAITVNGVDAETAGSNAVPMIKSGNLCLCFSLGTVLVIR